MNNGLDEDATFAKTFVKENWKQPLANISKLIRNLWMIHNLSKSRRKLSEEKDLLRNNY